MKLGVPKNQTSNKAGAGGSQQEASLKLEAVFKVETLSLWFLLSLVFCPHTRVRFLQFCKRWFFKSLELFLRRTAEISRSTQPSYRFLGETMPDGPLSLKHRVKGEAAFFHPLLTFGTETPIKKPTNTRFGELKSASRPFVEHLIWVTQEGFRLMGSGVSGLVWGVCLTVAATLADNQTRSWTFSWWDCPGSWWNSVELWSSLPCLRRLCARVNLSTLSPQMQILLKKNHCTIHTHTHNKSLLDVGPCMSRQSLPATRIILGNPTKRKQEPIWRRESFIHEPVLLLIAAFDLDANSWVC